MGSAEIVLPLVFRLISPNSVVDFGCGIGTWLAAARRLGAAQVLGLEGEWVRTADLIDPDIEIRTTNLEQQVVLPQRFDLAMSLEVAEHLSPGRAPGFVEDLCAAADMVLFGAATPGQGGKHHLNEQWQGYWADLFVRRGYLPIDVIRPVCWKDKRVKPWYCQNTVLYVAGPRFPEIYAKIPREQLCLMLDRAHPRIKDVKTTVGDALESVAWVPWRLRARMMDKLRRRNRH